MRIQSFNKRAKRSKVFDESTIDGYTGAAMVLNYLEAIRKAALWK